MARAGIRGLFVNSFLGDVVELGALPCVNAVLAPRPERIPGS